MDFIIGLGLGFIVGVVFGLAAAIGAALRNTMESSEICDFCYERGFQTHNM